MQQNLKYFIGERAENLAVVYLSRSKNLTIERMKMDYGIDLLITLLRDGLPTGRIFGVQVKGQDGVLKDLQEETVFKLSQKQKNYLKDLPFPVCAFLFTMEDDKGYYKWLKYPNKDNKSPSPPQNPWQSLDNLKVDQLIEEINNWYDEKSNSAA